MYGHIATATGWTPGQIDLLTLFEVTDLFVYWREYPPTHVLVAAYLLNRGEPTKRQPTNEYETLKAAIFQAGGGFGRKLPEAYRAHKRGEL